MDEYSIQMASGLFLLTAEHWYERTSEEEVEFTQIVMTGLSWEYSWCSWAWPAETWEQPDLKQTQMPPPPHFNKWRKASSGSEAVEAYT